MPRRRLFWTTLATTALLPLACPGPGPDDGTDFDGDGYDDNVDCEPEDPAISPGAAEVCEDDIDNDCDGRPDGWDVDCNERVSVEGGWLDVEVGVAQSCGIKADGTMVCWGCTQAQYDFGQCLAPPGTFSAVDAAIFTTCGLRTNGAIHCFGCSGTDPQDADLSNDHGQCDAPEGTFTQVSVGHYHGCGLHDDGSIECWGCDGPIPGAYTANQGQCDAPDGTFVDVSAGWLHSCAVREDGSVECWGYGGTGQLEAPAGEFASTVATYFSSCALGTDSRLSCWGCGAAQYNFGQCDAPQHDIANFDSTYWHGCAVDDGHEAMCWGCVEPGGDIDWGQCSAPDDPFDLIATGEDHNCGLWNGYLRCWGNDESGATTPP